MAHLAAHPGVEFTVRQLADVLNMDMKLVSNRVANMPGLKKRKVDNKLLISPDGGPAVEPVVVAADNDHEELVDRATARAEALAYLANHPGEHQTPDLAKALGWTIKRARYYLPLMAAQGLVTKRDTGHGVFYSAVDTSYGHGEYMPPAERPPGRETTKYKPKPKPAPLQEVPPPPTPATTTTVVHGDLELVAHTGVVIVLGRNPSNGRLRITLEKGE